LSKTSGLVSLSSVTFSGSVTSGSCGQPSACSARLQVHWLSNGDLRWCAAAALLSDLGPCLHQAGSQQAQKGQGANNSNHLWKIVEPTSRNISNHLATRVNPHVAAQGQSWILLLLRKFRIDISPFIYIHL
jgi:hypothetical protein